MSWRRVPIVAGVLSLALAACGGEQANESDDVQAGAANEVVGEQTIADALDQNSRFFQAAKAAGLDATLAGPGPYTVLVPSDEAFAALPDGALQDMMQPGQRARLTDVLTYHILPGTVLAEDIDRAIQNADGSAVLATMGGDTVSATRDGDRIVLTDASGGKATITQADQRRTNGVVHVIDGVLMPGDAAAADEEEAGSAPQ